MTRLEDLLLHYSREEAKGIFTIKKGCPETVRRGATVGYRIAAYRQNTLLLEAFDRAGRNIINIIYYRYHNSALVVVSRVK
ncbi:EscE/YscE/SsaE family type III secretion system needle protein co-chaperone [Salmonella enterica subsp. enterica]|nr:EscE/YscE/SsaE family type III secretion system needle protein co-chaperone [Salmonella enterica subsp. enterica]